MRSVLLYGIETRINENQLDRAHVQGDENSGCTKGINPVDTETEVAKFWTFNKTR